MAYLLPHLHSGWEVDQAIVQAEDRVVVIRFGHDQDPTCMVQDEVLMSIADKVKNFAVIYLGKRAANHLRISNSLVASVTKANHGRLLAVTYLRRS